MPELPEVETIRRGLSTCLLHKKIRTVLVFSEKSALPNANFLVKNLIGRSIIEVKRCGKLLIFHLSPSNLPIAARAKIKMGKAKQNTTVDYLLIHLMMTGQLIYLDKKIRVAGGHSLTANSSSSSLDMDSFTASVGGALPNKYTRAQINFLGGGILFFNDLRKFAYLKLVKQSELERLLRDNYGPEVLSPAFSLKFFRTLLNNKTIKIKALLLNQKLIAGLGNIYVDESLWRAKIDPERRANSLSLVEVKKLYTGINAIIKRAISYQGTTFSNYVDSSGQKGNFSRFLRVYGRSGEPCYNCGTLILKKKVAGRGTHYCPHCQK